MLAGRALPHVTILGVHSPKFAHQEVLQTLDVIDRSLEPAMLVAGMRVIYTHKYSSFSGGLPVVWCS